MYQYIVHFVQSIIKSRFRNNIIPADKINVNLIIHQVLKTLVESKKKNHVHFLFGSNMSVA